MIDPLKRDDNDYVHITKIAFDSWSKLKYYYNIVIILSMLMCSTKW